MVFPMGGAPVTGDRDATNERLSGNERYSCRPLENLAVQPPQRAAPVDGTLASNASTETYFGSLDRSALAAAGKRRRRVGEARLRRCCIGTATQPRKLKAETPSWLAFMTRSDDAELFHSAAERI